MKFDIDIDHINPSVGRNLLIFINKGVYFRISSTFYVYNRCLIFQMTHRNFRDFSFYDSSIKDKV